MSTSRLEGGGSPELSQRLDTASGEDIEVHLLACGDAFALDLGRRLDVREYAFKLARHARRIEAWDSRGHLIGLVAAYFDRERGQAFISNVSVLPEYRGRGLARRLMSRCEALAVDTSLGVLRLEVRATNVPARALYRSLGFSTESAEGESLILIRPIPSPGSD